MEWISGGGFEGIYLESRWVQGVGAKELKKRANNESAQEIWWRRNNKTPRDINQWMD